MLLELTSIPTASGREDRVIAWVEAWCRKRPSVKLRRDEFGNMMIQRDGARSRRPIVLSAHLDHPALVVCSVDGGEIEAELRGGVSDRFIKGASVRLHHGKLKPQIGRVTGLQAAKNKTGFLRVSIGFSADVKAEVGDIVTWDVPDATIKGDRLHAPAIDDLAGVAAALTAFDAATRRAGLCPDVRVLLTRAEEVGLIGASAACGSGVLPRGSRIIVLENSKALPEAPVGDGVIVRVGDYASVFDRELTERLTTIANDLSQRDKTFKWQRRLMSGGVCETTTFLAHGYTASCICLATLHAHNMNLETGRIDAEQISLTDYAGMLRLLSQVCRLLDNTKMAGRYEQRLREMLRAHRSLLGS